MVRIILGVDDAMLASAVILVFGLCLFANLQWWAYLITIVAVIIAFYGGRVSQNNKGQNQKNSNPPYSDK